MLHDAERFARIKPIAQTVYSTIQTKGIEAALMQYRT